MASAGSPGSERRPLDVGFNPSHHPLLPVEVVTRDQIRARVGERILGVRHRHDFHQLIVCRGGEGVHHVDFEPVEMRRGRLLHVHPGQVHEYQFAPAFDADVVVYRADLSRTFIPGYEWFPGSGLSVRWDFPADDFDVIVSNVEELRAEQERFDGSTTSVILMESLLATLLARIHRHAGEAPDASPLPEAFVSYCELVEQHFRERPTVAWFGRQLGYSTRTLDRACQAAVGRSAKTVLDERTALDIKRLLRNTDVAVTRIATAFGFNDPSSFSKFVTRQFGGSPTQVRNGIVGD